MELHCTGLVNFTYFFLIELDYMITLFFFLMMINLSDRNDNMAYIIEVVNLCFARDQCVYYIDNPSRLCRTVASLLDWNKRSFISIQYT